MKRIGCSSVRAPARPPETPTTVAARSPRSEATSPAPRSCSNRRAASLRRTRCSSTSSGWRCSRPAGPMRRSAPSRRASGSTRTSGMPGSTSAQHETTRTATTTRSRRFGALPRSLDRSSRPNPRSARRFDPPAGSTTRSPRPARRSPGTTAPRRRGTNLGSALPRRAISTPPRHAGIGCLNWSRRSTRRDSSAASPPRPEAGSTTRSAAIAICCRAIHGMCGVA